MARLARRSFVLLGVAALSSGCGGTLAPVGGNGRDGGGAEGGALDAGGQDSPGASDGPSVQDSPVVVEDAPLGMCQVDGVPCISASQCCSDACTADVCGNGTVTCLADGTACTSAAECCSDACDGTCGATPPPSCPVGTNAGPCEICVADDCCSDVVACEADTVCVESEQC